MVRKVLVIDDDAAIHALVKSHLGPQRFEVISAYDGASGLEAAAGRRPDVVLLDIDLPDLHGYEVCRRLKADRDTRSSFVLFLTAAATTDHKVRGLDVGAHDFITKPFDPAELRARVRAAVRTKFTIDGLREETMVDELTGLFNRKYFDVRLDGDLAIARRAGRPLGCVLADIDHMAAVNTALGTHRGDDVLHAAAQCVLATCRREDVVCRFEGDAFAILVGGADARFLNEFAERVRVAVRSAAVIYPERVVQVTGSVGVALSRFSLGTSIVTETEEALARAKAAGGDCVRAGHDLAELRLAV